MLMLNVDGADALLRGQLDTRDPPNELLVGQHERPAAIYGWLIHAKGRLAPGLTLVMEKLQTPLYRGVDIVCRASTKDGATFFDALGFSRGVWWDGEFRAEFRHYRRTHDGTGRSAIADRLRPPFDDDVPDAITSGPPAIKTKVVHTLDEMLKVFAIRSAVYIEEQHCPCDEEFDGNDFSGTHLLASIGGQPVGCLRIRYFGEFAKIERVAVLRRFRGRGIGHKLVTAAIELCRAKSYRRVYAHARRQLLPFWIEQGFAELASGRSFAFSDFEYVEIIRNLEPSDSALALAAGPYVLIRPEGQWDRPGILRIICCARRGRRGAGTMNVVSLPVGHRRAVAPVVLLVDPLRACHAGGRTYQLAGATAAIENCRKIVGFARLHGYPIAVTRWRQRDQTGVAANRFVGWLDGLEPHGADMVFEKPLPSCYSNPTFANMMASGGGEHAVLMGFTAALSCLSTIVDAHHRGHRLTFLADASANHLFDTPDANCIDQVVASVIALYARVSTAHRWMETQLAALRG